MDCIRVLVVEDHPLVCDATIGLLSKVTAGIQCHQATDVDSASRLLADRDWGLVLLDLCLPGACGMSFARTLHQRDMASRTCIVSAYNKAAYVAEARSLGFRGYVLKTYPTELFGDCIRTVLEGGSSYPLGGLADSTAMPRLTRKQLAVLKRVADGMSSKQVARNLLISEGTVNNHLTAVMRALNVQSRLAACRKAHQLGLIELADGRLEALGEVPA